MTRREKIWVLFAFLYAAVNIAVPFRLLKDVGSIWGAFMFWNILTLAVLLIGSWITSCWGGSGAEAEVRK